MFNVQGLTPCLPLLYALLGVIPPPAAAAPKATATDPFLTGVNSSDCGLVGKVGLPKPAPWPLRAIADRCCCIGVEPCPVPAPGVRRIPPLLALPPTVRVTGMRGGRRSALVLFQGEGMGELLTPGAPSNVGRGLRLTGLEGRAAAPPADEVDPEVAAGGVAVAER